MTTECVDAVLRFVCDRCGTIINTEMQSLKVAYVFARSCGWVINALNPSNPEQHVCAQCKAKGEVPDRAATPENGSV